MTLATQQPPAARPRDPERFARWCAEVEAAARRIATTNKSAAESLLDWLENVRREYHADR